MTTSTEGITAMNDIETIEYLLRPASAPVSLVKQGASYESEMRTARHRRIMRDSRAHTNRALRLPADAVVALHFTDSPFYGDHPLQWHHAI